MDQDTAIRLATARLREIEDPGTPLRLDPSAPRDIGWAWCCTFNTERYYETGNFLAMALSGPIVVVKDSQDVWIAGSAPPLEQHLNRYAARYGYPSVPARELP